MKFYALVSKKNQEIIIKNDSLPLLRGEIAERIRMEYRAEVNQRMREDVDHSNEHKGRLYARAAMHYFKNKTVVKVTMKPV